MVFTTAQMRVYMLERYYSRKAKAIAYLGGRCVVCGAIEDLEFDHVDPAIKSFTIGSRLSSIAETKLKPELDKCQLLCVEHHKEKHAAEHGSLGMWTHNKCRCDICLSAMRQYNREYKQKRKLNRHVTRVAKGRNF